VPSDRLDSHTQKCIPVISVEVKLGMIKLTVCPGCRFTTVKDFPLYGGVGATAQGHKVP